MTTAVLFVSNNLWLVILGNRAFQLAYHRKFRKTLFVVVCVHVCLSGPQEALEDQYGHGCGQWMWSMDVALSFLHKKMQFILDSMVRSLKLSKKTQPMLITLL